jgi:CheY-like chemotaxis protein
VCTPDGDSFLAVHAAAKAEERPFDLAVLDLTIPGGMGGKEAIRRLREHDQVLRAIVSSGYSNDPVMSQCTDYGFDAVLPKPYQVKELIQLVQQLGASPRNVLRHAAAA